MKTIKLTKKEVKHLTDSLKSNISLGFEMYLAERILDKLEKQLIIDDVSHCACTPDETTGTTTVRCCNICGKPAESFWRCG